VADPLDVIHPARRESYRVDTSPVVAGALQVDASPAVRESHWVDTSPVVTGSFAVPTESPAVRASYWVDSSPAVRESYRVDTAPVVAEALQVDASPAVRESHWVDTSPVVTGSFAVPTESPAVRESYRVEGSSPAVRASYLVDASPAVRESYRVDTSPVERGSFEVDLRSPAAGRSYRVSTPAAVGSYRVETSSSRALRSYRVPTSTPAAVRSYRLDDRIPAETSPDVVERGSLTIAHRVFERIAAVAASEVAGVGPAQGNHASQLLGRGMPRASAELAGSHVHLETTVPLRWPSTAPGVATAVRDHVGARVAELTGHVVDRVDVELGDTVRMGGRVRSGDPVTPAPARVPTGPAAAAVVGILVPLVLIGAGVLAVRDALIRSGSTGGSPLLPRGGRWIAGITPGSLLLGLSVAAVVVGLVLLLLGVKRRSRPDLVLDAPVPIHLHSGDVARVAAATADQVDGVRSARATATGSRIRVTVHTTGDNQQIADAVTSEVTQAVRAVRRRRGGSAPAVTTSMRST